MREHQADGLVSFGGGSPIDTAKLAVHAGLASGDGVPHIAIPTTLSAGEFTSVAGITDDVTRTKRAVHDARLAPRTVIADPAVTLATPAWLWAASGVRALDHAVESLYSNRHHPISDATAAKGLSLLLEHLPPSIAADGPDVLDHRARCQLAAWMSVFGMTNAGFGLSHALGHQIGPRWNVAHGITSCITLPHAMRFMARLAPERFAPVAAACGVAFDAGAAERRGAGLRRPYRDVHRAAGPADAPAGRGRASRGDRGRGRRRARPHGGRRDRRPPRRTGGDRGAPGSAF